MAPGPTWGPSDDVPGPPLPAEVQAMGDLARITVTDHDGLSVASIAGEVDISNVGQVSSALTELSNQALGLVVDLRAVDYLDSTGISLLHDLARRLRQRSQLLVIVSPEGSPPRRVLELTALDAQTAVFDELRPAIAALRDEFAG
jgi:anti-anti-sigma factor